jgi:hypothetical protein
MLKPLFDETNALLPAGDLSTMGRETELAQLL